MPEPIPDRRTPMDAHVHGEPLATHRRGARPSPPTWTQRSAPQPVRRRPGRIEPPISALAPLFRNRLERIYACRVDLRHRHQHPAHHARARGLLQVAATGARLLPRPQGRPAAPERAVRHLPARGRAPSRIHRAAIVRCPRLPARPRPDAQPAVLEDPRRPEAALGRLAGAALGRAAAPSAALEIRLTRPERSSWPSALLGGEPQLLDLGGDVRRRRCRASPSCRSP